MPQTDFITGPNYPSATSTVNGSGSDGAWANPANIFADDTSYATSSFLNVNTQTQELNGTGYGFNIPSNAVIDGITLEVMVISSNRWAEANGTVKLKKGGVNSGDNKAGTLSVSGGIYSYGGPSDLWGLSWTPADINASNFGFALIATYTTSPNDFAISIDYARITVNWHYDIDVEPADVPTRHLYKVFTSDGEYLGLLPNVITPFGYALDMNSAGYAMNVECGISADRSALPSSQITTEAGEPITTEAGELINTDGQPPILGQGSSLNVMMFKNGNRVEIWESSYYYPNGKLRFKGQMNRLQAGFGDGSAGSIKMVIRSDGLDLDNFVARGTPFNYTNDVVQTSQGWWITISQNSKGAGWYRYGQSWVKGASGPANIARAILLLKGAADVTMSVFDGPNGNLLGSITKSVDTLGNVSLVEFALANFIDASPGSTYFLAASVAPGQSIRIYYSESNPYSSGEMYESVFSGGSGGGNYLPMSGADLYFVTSGGTANTSATYTDKDPSTEVLEPTIDDYNARGGLVTYDADSIDATGLAETVQLNTETILDTIKKCLSIAPSGFYFYVDLGTSKLYFKQTGNAPDFFLIKGRHLNKLDFVMSIENVKNDLLLSGAESAGTNLYSEYYDRDSQARYGNRLERKSDNRVSVQSTADAIGTSFIEANKDEYFETTITVVKTTIDVTLFKPGKIVAIRGFGTFIDQLKLQIVRIVENGNLVDITVGNLPKRFSLEFEKVSRDLILQQTVANPSAPS